MTGLLACASDGGRPGVRGVAGASAFLERVTVFSHERLMLPSPHKHGPPAGSWSARPRGHRRCAGSVRADGIDCGAAES